MVDQYIGVDPLLEIGRLQKEVERLQRKIDYYEEPLPMGKGDCYHRFSDEGLCVRCGEDAESWDLGCVEEIVEDLKSVVEPQFVVALRGLIHDQLTDAHIDVAEKYLGRIEKFSRQFRWEEGDPGAMDMVERPDSGSDDEFTLSL